MIICIQYTLVSQKASHHLCGLINGLGVIPRWFNVTSPHIHCNYIISLISWDCRHFSISFIFQLGPAFCSLFFCVCLPTRFLALFFSLCFFYPYLPMCCFPACKNCGNFYVAFMLSGKINWFLFTIAFECWNVWSVPSFPRVARWLAWYVMGRCRAVWVLAKWMWWIGIWILSPQGMGG